MLEINKIILNNATELEIQMIINYSSIRKIDREILPKCAMPASNVNNIDNFQNRINSQLFKYKTNIDNIFNNNNSNNQIQINFNSLPIKNRDDILKIKNLLNTKGSNETIISFINEKLTVDRNKNLYGVDRDVKDIYCIFGKFQLKKSIIKVTKPDASIPISALELLAVYTKAYQYIYKQDEQWFNAKKGRMGYHKSPHGIYKYGINFIRYNGLSTIVEFDSFIVCSFDIDSISKHEIEIYKKK